MTVDQIDYERVKFRDDVVPIWEVRFVVEAKGFGRSQVRNIGLVTVSRLVARESRLESVICSSSQFPLL